MMDRPFCRRSTSAGHRKMRQRGAALFFWTIYGEFSHMTTTRILVAEFETRLAIVRTSDMRITPRNNSATFLEEEYGGRRDCDPTVTGIIAGTAETCEGTLHEASGLGRWRPRSKFPIFVIPTLKESFRNRMSTVVESRPVQKILMIDLRIQHDRW